MMKGEDSCINNNINNCLGGNRHICITINFVIYAGTKKNRIEKTEALKKFFGIKIELIQSTNQQRTPVLIVSYVFYFQPANKC